MLRRRLLVIIDKIHMTVTLNHDGGNRYVLFYAVRGNYDVFNRSSYNILACYRETFTVNIYIIFRKLIWLYQESVHWQLDKR